MDAFLPSILPWRPALLCPVARGPQEPAGLGQAPGSQTKGRAGSTKGITARNNTHLQIPSIPATFSAEPKTPRKPFSLAYVPRRLSAPPAAREADPDGGAA